MKRSSNIITGITAAAVTFGSLFAIAGSQNFGRHRFYNNWNHCDIYNPDKAKSNNYPGHQNRNLDQQKKAEAPQTNF